LKLDVATAATSIISSPHWNSNKHRTVNQDSPHREAGDIWARFGDLNDPAVRNNLDFDSHWYYPELKTILEPLVNDVMRWVGGTRLGGVLITRIPAGKQIYRHKDSGWHASYFSKYCVCIQANPAQVFAFEDSELRTETGECFWFDNSHEHWVTNPTDEDRISLICCIKTPRGIHQP
jgi:hypothetical protein